MRAARRIERLLHDLQLSPTGGLLCGPSDDVCEQRLPICSPRYLPAYGFRIPPPRTSTRLLALPSTTKDSLRVTSTNGSQDESGKISKQLAEQRALVATLEVEVSAVLQEKSILESVYREHVQQLEGEIVRLQQKLGRYYEEDADAAVCEDLLRLLQELFSHDLTITQPLYTELLAVSEDKRKARDQILMLVYEKMVNFHEDSQKFLNERENFRATLIKADEEMKRLRTELQQACDTAASEKQEMLQEVQRLTREWQNLSIAAAGDKQELIREIRMLTDEHRKVAEATDVEKQDMHNEIGLLTQELRNLQATTQKERESIRTEVHRLTDKLQQSTVTADLEKKEMAEEVQILTKEVRLIAETSASEKQILNQEIQRLLSELQQHSTMAASVRDNLNEEVNILKDELHELSTFAAAEKQEMTDELHRLTGKMKRLFAAAAAEKQAMQLKLDVTNARNERLAKEAQHALIELDSLTDKCALNCQLKASLNSSEKIASSAEEKHLMKANLQELMIEKQKLMDIIEAKDRSLDLLRKVRIFEIKQEEQQGTLQELWRVPQEQHNICDQFGMHNFRVSPYQQQLQLTKANMVCTNEGLEIVQEEAYEERISSLGRRLMGQNFPCRLEMQEYGDFAAAIGYASHTEDNSPHSVNNRTKTDVDNKKNAICKALLSVLNNCHLE